MHHAGFIGPFVAETNHKLHARAVGSLAATNTCRPLYHVLTSVLLSHG